MLKLNPLDHPICLAMPRRLTPLSAWYGHIPFAMFLVDLLRPRILVELGTHSGDSYCSFCQAVKELGLNTLCYAVDTWKGDPHSSGYGSEVLDDLRKHHDPLYGGFSHLIQSTFDDALRQFDDRTIDLLHIDGYHTYEAVKHDFESWLPKMRPSGVVLLHDISERQDDFGVWRLWEETKRKYRSFEFFHCHGLGVLATGKEESGELAALLTASDSEATVIREFFSQLGARVTMAWDYEAVIRNLQAQIAQMERSVGLRTTRKVGELLAKLRLREG
jgi:hypothetical protein